jgi:hypothetical protein
MFTHTCYNQKGLKIVVGWSPMTTTKFKLVANPLEHLRIDFRVVDTVSLNEICPVLNLPVKYVYFLTVNLVLFFAFVHLALPN